MDERDQLIEELALEVERLAAELEGRDAVCEAQDIMLAAGKETTRRINEDRVVASRLADFWSKFGPAP